MGHFFNKWQNHLLNRKISMEIFEIGRKVVFQATFLYFPSYFSHSLRYSFAQKDLDFFLKNHRTLVDKNLRLSLTTI